MEMFSPHYSTLLNMFNAELDVCKQLYDEHMKQVSGRRISKCHPIMVMTIK